MPKQVLQQKIARIYDEVQSLIRQMNNSYNEERAGELRRKIAKLEWDQEELILQVNDTKDHRFIPTHTTDVWRMRTKAGYRAANDFLPDWFVPASYPPS